MKTILLFFILFNLSISQNEYYNIERSGRTGGCTPSDLVKDIMTSSKPTVSDCVDRELEKGNYGSEALHCRDSCRPKRHKRGT